MIETPADILAHHADFEACHSFICWRRTIRKPLTERAAMMIAKTLSVINAGGGDATEALDMAQEHGWQTIKPEWYWRQKNGNGNINTGYSKPDTTTLALTFAARARRTPTADSF